MVDQRLQRTEVLLQKPTEEPAQSFVEIEPVVSRSQLLDEDGNIDINKLESALWAFVGVFIRQGMRLVSPTIFIAQLKARTEPTKLN